MTSFQVKVTFLLLSFCVFQSTPLKFKPPKCRGGEIKVSNEDMEAIGKCMSDLVPDAKPDDDAEKISKAIPKEKMACLGKCILAAEGLICEKGLVSKDKWMAKVNATLPQEAVEDMDAAIEKCVDEQGKGLDPEDKTCQTYQGLTQCMMMAFVEVCKIKKE